MQIKGHNGLIELNYLSTYGQGGNFETYIYKLDISVDNFRAFGNIEILKTDLEVLKNKFENSIADFIDFSWKNLDTTLLLEIHYNKQGQVDINGVYKSLPSSETKLLFNISSDQSFFTTMEWE